MHCNAGEVLGRAFTWCLQGTALTYASSCELSHTPEEYPYTIIYIAEAINIIYKLPRPAVYIHIKNQARPAVPGEPRI